MTQQTIPFIVGGIFVVLGIVGIIWGFNEGSKYENALSRRFDVREYIERTPFRPEPGALKIGGTIAIIVGLAVVGLGFYLWFR